MEDPLVNGNLLRTFFRVRVGINVKKAIPTGCWVPRKDLPNAWVVFRYERMQDLCYNCGILGHDQRSCKKEKVIATHDQSVPRYGPSLGVPPARPLAIIAAEQGRWAPTSQHTSPKADKVAPAAGNREGDQAGADRDNAQQPRNCMLTGEGSSTLHNLHLAGWGSQVMTEQPRDYNSIPTSQGPINEKRDQWFEVTGITISEPSSKDARETMEAQ